jgi:glycosyltransferase involved in cell wall biosynthesis/Tfp pilus assembly protein PilF
MNATDGVDAARRRAKGHYGLALAWLKRGRVKHALVELERARSVDPGHREAWIEQARLLAGLHRWSDLVELCRQGLRRFADASELHKLHVTGLEGRGSLDDAYDAYELRRADARDIAIAPDAILCCVTVRNERARLPGFLAHYRRLGVDRFLFVDNGSDDGTADWLLGQPDVHLWRSTLSFTLANFGSAWFELLLRRYGVDRWCLTVDADELIVYEDHETRSLHALCRELDEDGLQAASGILLDLYSDRPVRDTTLDDATDWIERCPWFDREFFHRRHERAGPYRNQLVTFGGVRQRVFPAEHDYLLSKVPLLRYRPDVVLQSGQHLTSIPSERIAHEEVCVLHFKFFASFLPYARSEAERAVHAMDGEQYKAYAAGLGRDEALTLHDRELSVRYEGVAQLRALGVMAPEPRPHRAPPPRIAPVAEGAPRPFWSVMITLHSRLHNLEGVVRSVLAQATPDMQIEVIHDGGDGDSGAEVARRLRAIAGGRVALHCPAEPAGHPDVFNLCIERARGEWVHILHDDDRVEPGFYEALRRGIDATPGVGAAFCQHALHHDHDGETTLWRSWVERETPGVIDDWLGRIAVECRVQFSAMTVRRSVYESLGGFRPDARSAFDWEMWTRVAVAHDVWYVPDVLASIGRDGSAESTRLERSGEQVAHAFRAIAIAADALPPGRSASLTRKARERLVLRALALARRWFERGDTRAALANLRAATTAPMSEQASRALAALLAETREGTAAVADACRLGRAAVEQGRDDEARGHYERAVALDPGCGEANRYLADARVRDGDLPAALDHLGRAMAAMPEVGELRSEHRLLRQVAGFGGPAAGLPDHPGGKLRFRTLYDLGHHRSGWRDALAALHPLHHREGVLFDDFLEDPFAYQHPRGGVRTGAELLRAMRGSAWQLRLTSEELRIVPFREPWVGFLHNPPGMPDWFHGDASPQAIFAKQVWRDSLPLCRGLFVLSEHHARWLRSQVDVPVSVLTHPTARPALRFDLDRFLANPDKRIVQIGWWLRRLSSIHRLPLAAGNRLGYRKLRLVPAFSPGADAHLRELLARECAAHGYSVDPDRGDVECRPHLPDDDYDALLAENVAFVDLIDASANNTVIECLARGTPLLVNRLPAVEEYLGADYPLYFADLGEAAAFAQDVGRLRAAHEHLVASPMQARIEPARFRRDLEASEVYGRL